jgi:hypothetical protein
MISRTLFASLFLSAFTLVPAYAQENPRPDDSIAYDISAEDWVTTKTAHVILDVEAAVNGTNEGAMRTDMAKAVNDAAKADWRLTSFTRANDQTGMERWSVNFDARLPESELNGLSDAVKKASKAGMQISVASVDFDPTLDEAEATRESVRAHIFKEAADQLAILNTALPGRNYRIAQISFDADAPMQPRIARHPMMMLASAVPAPSSPDSMPDHAQKIALTAHVVFAAAPIAAH